MPISPGNLRCEYHVDPLGVDVERPRLSWECVGEGRNQRQGAYQVQVADGAAGFDGALLWDSGKVASSDSAHIAYDGPALRSHQRVSWRVRLWDGEDTASGWSAPARWAMGMLSHADWHAQWISSPAWVSPNAPYLRRAFTVREGLVDARLYATARGIFRAYVNGHRVGDEDFAPGWTDYPTRTLYRCHDVTAALRAGGNCLGAMLAEGWFKGPLGFEGAGRIYGARTEFLACLRLEYADGSVEHVGTDGEWRTRNSPVLETGFLRGEYYDAQHEIDGWCTPGADAAGWSQVGVHAAPGATPVLQWHPGVPVRVTEELRPRNVRKLRAKTFLFDLGQNFAGRVRLTVHAPAGTILRLRHGEMLQPDGEIYVDNLRAATSIDTYVCRGGGESWEPVFTFHGFQYVELTGLDEADADTVTGVVLGSDTPRAGSFECSDERINKLYSNTVWTQRANFLEIPTDCPQRDERLGWTGDAQAFIRTAIWSMDVASFFTKWMYDVNDAQDLNKDGAFPNVAPNLRRWNNEWGIGRGDAAWGDAGTICPWTLFRCYGDRELLARCYPHMKRWIEYYQKTSQGGVLRFHREGLCVFGDWLSVKADTPREIIMSAFFAYSTQLTAQAAEALGHKEDAERLRALHGRIRAAFVAAFVKDDGRVVGVTATEPTQTGYLLALHFDLMPEHLRAKAVQHLVDDIEGRGWHLSTGFVGLPYLLPVLARGGRSDVAFRLLTTDTYPSWLYPVKNGATTIWERWNGWTEDGGAHEPGMNSFSHYAYGAVGEWLFSDVAGIEELATGFRRVRIRPRIGGGLTWAEATHRCIRGPIRSAWRVADGEVALEVAIPANVEADVHVPCDDVQGLRESGATVEVERVEDGYAVVLLGSGSYRFTAPYGAAVEVA